MASNYEFVHNTISQPHTQANGMVEKVVSIVKNMLRKCHESENDPYFALFNFRNASSYQDPLLRLFSIRIRFVISCPGRIQNCYLK